MIQSMTGYGRASQVLDGKEITFEIKSVNHRFFECSVRAPRAYGYLEDRVRAYVKGQISRGKIDVNLSIVLLEGANARVEANRELAAAYVNELRSLSEP